MNQRPSQIDKLPLPICHKETELLYIKRELDNMDKKLDEIIEGQNEIKTAQAINNERHIQQSEALKRYGDKLDKHDERIRDLEEADNAIKLTTSENTKARTKVQTWLERLGLLALAAWLGIDDFDP